MSGVESFGGVGGKEKRECEDDDVTEGSDDDGWMVMGADGEGWERDLEKGDIQPE